jgi:hypothetical protein
MILASDPPASRKGFPLGVARSRPTSFVGSIGYFEVRIHGVCVTPTSNPSGEINRVTV